MLLLRAIHFLGGIFWIGGIVAVAFAAAALRTSNTEAGSGNESVRALRAVSLKVATTGMVAAWIGGLGILLPAFTSHYATQGWMHAKLTLVLIAAALSGLLSAQLRRAEAGEPIATGAVRAMGFALTAIAILIVLLVTAKPF